MSDESIEQYIAKVFTPGTPEHAAVERERAARSPAKALLDLVVAQRTLYGCFGRNEVDGTRLVRELYAKAEPLGGPPYPGVDDGNADATYRALDALRAWLVGKVESEQIAVKLDERVSKRRRTSAQEREDMARKLLRQGKWTVARLAKRLGCSSGTACGLQAWRAYLGRGSSGAGTSSSSPKTIHLSNELAALIADQQSDMREERRRR